MKPTYGVFTETLLTLTSFEKRATTATATENDYIAIQKFQSTIFSRHTDGYYNYDEYIALYDLSMIIKDRIKYVLEVNKKVREIERRQPHDTNT